MTDATKYLKLTVAAILAGLAAFTLLAASAPKQADAAELSCPTFRVLHNDRIGNVSFPAGTYGVTVLDDTKLSCAQASKLFAEFLQDWDGKLRSPWVLKSNRTFTRGPNSRTGFRVAPNATPNGGGGSTSRSCPGYFRVVHNDSIGSFKVPSGQYRLTLVNPNRFTCAKAVRMFQEFLLDYDGVLPSPWVLNQRTATFYKRTNRQVGFNINQAYGPPPNPGKNTRFARCPATFQVMHNDRIGALALPKGPYYIYVGTNNPLSCGQASQLFRQFLNYPDGRLPAPWNVNPKKARFRGGPGGQVFRVQQAF